MSEFPSEEKELIDRLVETGVRERRAKVLVTILDDEEIKSPEIQEITGLKQPEVSIAVNDLKEKGWVSMEKRSSEGRGRPFHYYHIDRPFPDIVREVEEKQKGKIREIEENIKRLKDLPEKREEMDEFSSEEVEFIDSLIRADLDKNEAKALTVISVKEGATRKELESITDLQQPRVSISVGSLRDKDWVEKEKLEKEGRGRPSHLYKLKKDLSDIVEELEASQKEKIEKMENDLSRFRKAAESVQ